MWVGTYLGIRFDWGEKRKSVDKYVHDIFCRLAYMAPDQQCSNIAGVHRLYTRIEVNILFSPLLTRHDARRKLGRVRIFADAQAAITRMTHDEPGPGQTYALQVRMAIATLREREPSVEIKIRWCPAHNGIPGNEVADGWAKQAASEPDDRGVECLA